eukprot:Gb_39768 [translate_table: standard]
MSAAVLLALHMALLLEAASLWFPKEEEEKQRISGFQYIRSSSLQFFQLQIKAQQDFQMVELRVGMHCEKCIKEIKRAIRRVEGVETYKLDTVCQKVTVTGDVTPKQLSPAPTKLYLILPSFLMGDIELPGFSRRVH